VSRNFTATFEAARPRRRRVRDSAGKEWVERDAELIFKAGDYNFPPEQGGPFSVTPEDIRRFVTEWSGSERICDLEDTHAPSIFNGRLGHFAAVRPSPDYTRFGGTVRLEPWFEELFANEPIKLSANWKRDPANPSRPLFLNKVAVVPNPRISDAAMMSALFNAGASGRGDYLRHLDAAFERRKNMDSTTLFLSPKKLLHFIHDHCAAAGARCTGELHGQLPHSERAGSLQDYGAHGNDRELILRSAAGLSAGFGAGPDSAGLQQMHDLAASLLGSGAACAQWRLLMSQGGGVSTPSYKPGSHYHAAVTTLPAFKDYEPGRFYSSAPAYRGYEPQSAGLSDYDDLDAAAARMDAAAFNEFGVAPFAATTVAGWAAEARAEALAYAERRNGELAANPTSGMDAAADLPPNR
jgi:hypothetical protein